MYTLASDMLPRGAGGSVVGLGSMAGAIGALAVSKAVGYILPFTGSNLLVFLIAGSAYRFAFLLVQISAPRIAPISVEGAPA